MKWGSHPAWQGLISDSALKTSLGSKSVFQDDTQDSTSAGSHESSFVKKRDGTKRGQVGDLDNVTTAIHAVGTLSFLNPVCLVLRYWEAHIEFRRLTLDQPCTRQTPYALYYCSGPLSLLIIFNNHLNDRNYSDKNHNDNNHL